MSDQHSGIIAWFARNSVAANLLMWGILVMGAISAWTIKKEFFPEFSLNTVVIRVPYLGGTPEEVEKGVCIKIEEALQDLEGIKQITSYAAEGVGTVRVEIEADYDLLNLLDKIKLRVDAISSFPGETEKPVIYEETTKHEVIWVQVYGDVSRKALKEYGKKIRDEMLAVPGITQIELRGVRDYEISIEVSEKSLREFGLTFDDIVRAIRNSSLDLPAGSIKTAGGEVLLRTKGQAYHGVDFEELVLRTHPDGTRLLLRDVAVVVDGFEEVNREVRFNRKPSVSLQIFRVSDQSALEIAEAVKRFVAEKNSQLPDTVRVSYWADGARLLKGRLNLMLRNAFLGGLLVFLSLTLFLRFKVALWVMVGLPVCFLGALWLMPFPGVDISINMITLFGFILVLGIVVDDAIVIGENVFTTIRRDGQSLENVIRGAREVAVPATFGVLTTVAAFLPMLMVPGPNGKIWGGIGMVVILCLLFSLVESKLILPAHLVHMKITHRSRDDLGSLARFQRRFADGLESFVQGVYQPVLVFSLRNRYAVVASFIALLVVAIGLVQGGIVRRVIFPDVETDFPSGMLAMVEGTPASVTKAAAVRMEQAAYLVDQALQAERGEPVVLHILNLLRSDTEAMLIVELTPGEDRRTGAVEFVNRWREKVGDVPGAKEIAYSGSIMDSGSPIDFQFSGSDYWELDRAADALQEKLNHYAGVFDIKDSFSRGKQEVQLSIKPGAEILGLTLNDLARQVRQGFYGAEAQRIQRGRDEVRVMVRYPQERRRSLGDLEEMRIRTPAGDEVPFASVAEVQLGRGYATIKRVDRKRVVNVTARVDKELVEPQKIIKDLQSEFVPGLLARYPGVSYTMEGESREQKEVLMSLAKGGVFALILIYAQMAIPLKSYVKPLIIMSVIPFGCVGAIFGHLLLGLPISILSLCGIIALAGVVVNDSLVMVDFINRNEGHGLTKMEAVQEAGIRRFRPIFLTSLTTFVGLSPMIFERSLQAQFLIPMAVSLAFGILFATIITLLLIPSLYLLIDDVGKLLIALYRPTRVAGLEDRPEGRSQPEVL